MNSSPSEQAFPEDERRRVAPLVALALLEVIRDQDLPGELLAAEDVSLTLPRRLGLSEVIEAQIRRYREEMKRRNRVTDAQIRDLVRLVVRRPDSEDVFRLVGGRLAGVEEGRPGWRKILPRPIAFALARRRARKRLKTLFGRPLGQFRSGPFELEGRDLLLIRSDPGGEACFLMSGLLSTILQRYAGRGVSVVHEVCQARQGDTCRWTMREDAEEERPEEDPVSEPGPTSEVA